MACTKAAHSSPKMACMRSKSHGGMLAVTRMGKLANETARTCCSQFHSTAVTAALR